MRFGTLPVWSGPSHTFSMRFGYALKRLRVGYYDLGGYLAGRQGRVPRRQHPLELHHGVAARDDALVRTPILGAA